MLYLIVVKQILSMLSMLSMFIMIKMLSRSIKMLEMLGRSITMLGRKIEMVGRNIDEARCSNDIVVMAFKYCIMGLMDMLGRKMEYVKMVVVKMVVRSIDEARCEDIVVFAFKCCIMGYMGLCGLEDFILEVSLGYIMNKENREFSSSYDKDNKNEDEDHSIVFDINDREKFNRNLIKKGRELGDSDIKNRIVNISEGVGKEGCEKIRVALIGMLDKDDLKDYERTSLFALHNVICAYRGGIQNALSSLSSGDMSMMEYRTKLTAVKTILRIVIDLKERFFKLTTDYDETETQELREMELRIKESCKIFRAGYVRKVRNEITPEFDSDMVRRRILRKRRTK